MALIDPGTLEVRPAGLEERSGVVAGAGLVHGVGTVAFSSDPRVQGGAMGSAGCVAIVGAYAEALSRGVPVVGLWQPPTEGRPRQHSALRACFPGAGPKRYGSALT